MRQLNQKASAVTGAWVAPLGPSVVEVLEYLESFFDDIVGLMPLDIDDKPDPTASFSKRGSYNPCFFGSPGTFI